MNTDPKTVARFLATAIWADGEFSEMERKCLHNIAQDYKLETLETDMESLLLEIAGLQGDALTDSLTSIAPQVDPEEKDNILALCLQLMGCDDYLADEEITNFFVIANILGIKEERALSLLSSLTSEEEVVRDK
ncbi:MAG: TerB family tellurite resistance protein [Bacteroidales bacterium]|nr:TerB family tellurite resistance protein [Bacteroidales bacterium]